MQAIDLSNVLNGAVPATSALQPLLSIHLWLMLYWVFRALSPGRYRLWAPLLLLVGMKTAGVVLIVHSAAGLKLAWSGVAIDAVNVLLWPVFFTVREWLRQSGRRAGSIPKARQTPAEAKAQVQPSPSARPVSDAAIMAHVARQLDLMA